MKKNEQISLLGDYTGNLFATHFMYIAPMVGWYEPGAKYDIELERQILGTAICEGLTIYRLDQITTNMTLLAFGMRKQQWKRHMYIKYGATDETPMAIMIFNWMEMDVAILKALMEIRFNGMKGLKPHELKAQLELILD
jgi:uncharacterized protein YbaP (TraB family)